MSSKVDLGPWPLETALPAFAGYALTVKLANLRDYSGVLVLMRASKPGPEGEGAHNYEANETQTYEALLDKEGEGAFWQVKNRLMDALEARIAADAPPDVEPQP
jgi:hypothetical protein